MQFKLRSFIDDLTDRTVNKNVYVKKGAVYVKDGGSKFKFEFGDWYVYTDKWVNLQGGVPAYTYEADENLDDGIFEKIEGREV